MEIDSNHFGGMTRIMLVVEQIARQHSANLSSSINTVKLQGVELICGEICAIKRA
jgi:hypothetical protein